MKKFKPLLIGLGVLLLVAGAYLFVRARNNQAPTTGTNNSAPVLPVNQIPLSERPFVTLTPDASGRNLTLMIDNMSVLEEVEYELVYDAGEKQEGAFGRIDFETEKQPVEKELLLGSRSAGGAVTYHEGVTGGNLSLIYSEQKLKEDFNFLTFGEDETYSSKDGRFTATLPARSLRTGSKLVVMKSFGLPDPLEGEVVVGPYAILTSTALSMPYDVEISVPQSSEGELVLFGYSDEWEELESTVEGGFLTAEDVTSYVFAVVAR